MAALPPFRVERLAWEDEALGAIPLPKASLDLTRSYGSGLARRQSDPPGHVWAVGDRGPNLKIDTLIERYGADHLASLQDLSGAKVMPRPDVGPQLALLKVGEGRVDLVETFPLTDRDGCPLSGLPLPGSEHSTHEPAFTLEGERMASDATGLDTEGVVALEDGSFIFSDEFGPSLVRADSRGRVVARYVPAGVEVPGARCPVHQSLPAVASRRQLNRGFEAIAISPDQRSLLLAFQSPLAHPDEATHKRARHVRIWRLDPATMRVQAQYLYPFDPPDTFLQDNEEEKIEWGDLKISELICLPGGAALVLERASKTTKIYRIRPGAALPPKHLEVATRPTLEQSSADGDTLDALEKELLFTTDEARQVSPDLEGMVVLSSRELLLVNDSDFGVEGATTSFWMVTFAEPVLG